MVNLNVTIDGNPHLTTTVVFGAQTQTYDGSFYNIQSMPSGNHQVTLLLLDWITGGNSVLWFDYAAINETFISPSSAVSGSRSSQ